MLVEWGKSSWLILSAIVGAFALAITLVATGNIDEGVDLVKWALGGGAATFLGKSYQAGKAGPEIIHDDPTE